MNYGLWIMNDESWRKSIRGFLRLERFLYISAVIFIITADFVIVK